MEKESPPEREEETEYNGAAHKGDEEIEEIAEDELTIGKCPKCGIDLPNDDFEDIEFRGVYHRHTAYMCQKCNTIIGFSAMRH